MRAHSAIYMVESGDEADNSFYHLSIRGRSELKTDITLFFPDRTPRDKIQAIADAINAALAAAREIEGAGRD